MYVCMQAESFGVNGGGEAVCALTIARRVEEVSLASKRRQPRKVNKASRNFHE